MKTFTNPHDLIVFFENRVTYKPNSKKSGWINSHGGMTLNLESVVTDATGTISPEIAHIKVVFTKNYDRQTVAKLLHIDPSLYLKLLRDFFGEWEAHERDEWLKVDGKPLFPQHAETEKLEAT